MPNVCVRSGRFDRKEPRSSNEERRAGCVNDAKFLFGCHRAKRWDEDIPTGADHEVCRLPLDVQPVGQTGFHPRVLAGLAVEEARFIATGIEFNVIRI